MKRIVTMGFVVAGLLVATSAMALNRQQHQGTQQSIRVLAPASSQAVIGCDNGMWNGGGWYQNDTDRLGNMFDFGAGAMLSSVSFFSYGWGLAGPYDYDIEIWDPASCTKVTGKPNLVAGDAASSPVEETVDMCANQVHLAGAMMVTVAPKTCPIPTDCYPGLIYDSQMNVQCPVIIANATTSPICYDMSTQQGPFLFRVATDGCATPTHRNSWGQLKSIYR